MPPLNVGTYSITATYSGDTNFQANSNANTISQTITKDDTTTRVTTSNAFRDLPVTRSRHGDCQREPAGLGHATGTVTFLVDGAVAMSNVSLVNGGGDVHAADAAERESARRTLSGRTTAATATSTWAAAPSARRLPRAPPRRRCPRACHVGLRPAGHLTAHIAGVTRRCPTRPGRRTFVIDGVGAVAGRSR